MDNVFIELLWWSLKYECVCLHKLAAGLPVTREIGTWFNDYNEERVHSAFDDETSSGRRQTRRVFWLGSRTCCARGVLPVVGTLADRDVRQRVLTHTVFVSR